MMNFEVGEVHRKAPHLLADLVELYLIISNWESLSKSDVSQLVAQGVISSEEIDDVERHTSDITDAEENELQDIYVENLWLQLIYRQNNMGEYYPFFIDGNTLCRKPIDLARDADKFNLYILLLACSRLRSFPAAGGVRQRWAKLFAIVSREAMVSMLPEHSEVHIFDANSDDRRRIYGTDLRDALKLLASKMAFVSMDNAIDEQKPGGDYGIDLVGMVRFDDNGSGEHFILGQCGAQEEEWPSKTLESHPIALRPVINITHDGTNTMFTPVCYRQPSGVWVNLRPTGGTLVIDRPRILKLISKNDERLVNIMSLEDFSSFIREFSSVSIQ
ncbi:hypothetical protein [Aeromonas caviae]|uniref:hypothetical protein n=1 Tax=Aeromonas caviae TaxID=648 RepID=UPI002B49C77A|nr:hypothetical protein [Aeromonas caviae]